MMAGRGTTVRPDGRSFLAIGRSLWTLILGGLGGFLASVYAARSVKAAVC